MCDTCINAQLQHVSHIILLNVLYNSRAKN